MQLVWHRGDLRVHDHPALHAALLQGETLGLVVLDPNNLQGTSARRRALFYRSVRALRSAYRQKGGVLLVRRGDPASVLAGLARSLPLDTVHALASFTPYGTARDAAVRRALAEVGVGLRWHDGLFVHSPGTVRSASDDFYSVFAPFFRRWSSLGTPDPLPAPGGIPSPRLPADLEPGDVPDERSEVPLPAPDEGAAFRALEEFVEERLAEYARRRDRLEGSGTSRLSVWITLGVLSARSAAARVEAAARGGNAEGARKWLAELAWRDFLADLLYHRPDLRQEPFHSRWADLDWVPGDDRFRAWRDGRTGVPAVDAAMRQLRETGWISNRARMIAAQFLAKNLRVDWRRGERVFRDWLLDGDAASNVGNWQWAAGLGIDNAPYFRVMNPESQARRHDPDGRWLRRWAPASGGDPSPRNPLVDPAEGRRQYLEAARRVTEAGGGGEPPPAPLPPLELATDSRLAVVAGVGPALATRILDGLASGTQLRLEELSGVGPILSTAIRRRFATDR